MMIEFKGAQIMKVNILDGCTGCGACNAINGDIFEIDDYAHVNSKFINGNEQDCIDAAIACPVGVIAIEDF